MERIGVLLPTINRPEFVQRCLNDLIRQKFTGWVCIADSSANNETRKVVQTVIDQLNITYLSLPKKQFKNEISALNAAANIAKTPYLIFLGDDDFLDIDNVVKLAEFLDNNQNFSMASGGQIRFFVDTSNNVNIDRVILLHDFSSPSPMERFKTYMRTGQSVMYSLMRTEVMQSILKYHEVIILPAIGNEILLCCLAVLSGRGMSFPFIISYQQGEHSKTIFPRTNQPNKLPTFYEIMTRKSWPTQYAKFRQIVIDKMVQEGVHIEQASLIFDSEMVNRIVNLLHSQATLNYSFHQTDKAIWILAQREFLSTLSKQFVDTYVGFSFKNRLEVSINNEKSIAD